MNVDYSTISKIYDKYRSYPRHIIEKIIELGDIKEVTKVLDLGCGTGNISSRLLKVVKARIVGIDLSVPMLEAARGKSLEVLCADMDNFHLPFHDGAFDVAIGAYVVHQVKNLGLLLSECHRVLRDGTLVILTSSHKQIERQHPIIKQFFPSFVNIDKARFPDIPSIDCLLSSAGFTDIEHREVIMENLVMDEEYLQKVKNKYVSTYHLIPQSEFETGVKGLEAFIKSKNQPELREWRGTIIRGRKT